MFADGEISYKVTLDDSGAIKSLEKLDKQGTNLSTKFSKVGKTMSVAVTAPITALATAGIKYNASMETYAANLTTLLNGNQKAASQLLSDLKKMANTTPFETTSLVKATQTMLGFGVELKDSQKYLKQLGDIAMGDANKLDGLTLAFSQVQSAGKLTGQDLLQMINQGFNPLNVISQKTGESMASLKERMGNGAISAQEVAQALQWATEKGGLFYGAMDKASQTTEGKLSTLKDEFNSAVGEMTTSLLPIFTKVVDKLTEIARWIGNLSPKQKELIVLIAGVAAAIGPLLIVMSKIGPLISGIATAIGFITSPVGLVILAIGALIGVFVYLMATSEEFRQAMSVIFSFVWSIIQPVIQNIMNLFTGLVQIIKGCVMVISGLLTGDFKMVGDGFCSIFRGIGNVAISVLNGVINTINKFIKFFVTGINTIIGLVNKIPGIKFKKLSFSIPNIPKLAVGTNYVQSDGLAFLHQGEAVVPKKYNPAVGGYGSSNQPIYVIANVDMDINKFGKAFVKDIKTFSGGAKSSYNFGGSK